MRVLITGGAGYVGSHTAKAFALAGAEVVVYDNLSSGHRDFVKWGAFEHGDVRDYAALAGCLERHRPDGVVHFAAKSSVGESTGNPGKYYSNNLAGTLALLEAMRDAGVPALVMSGTCSVYGQPDRVPIDESQETRPISPYGASKLFMERMLADFGGAHGLKWTSLRYFNAAGSDAECEVGERHEPEAHLIPLALMAAAGIGPELVLFGDKLATPDGTCVRDFVHVADLADAHLMALERLLKGGGSGCINLGTGTGHSVREVIASVERVTGRKLPVRAGPPRAGDPLFLVADNRLAAAELGWRPRRTDLDGIVESAWRWLRRDRGM